MRLILWEIYPPDQLNGFDRSQGGFFVGYNKIQWVVWKLALTKALRDEHPLGINKVQSTEEEVSNLFEKKNKVI